MRDKTRVLFLCTHNSARSQMAEGYLRHLVGARFEIASAGTEPSRVHPLAIRAMREVGIDIAGHTSKPVKPFLGDVWHYVITVCDHANEYCPIFPFPSKRLHWSFPDPSQATGAEGERLQVFRQVRDAIISRIQEWVTEVDQQGAGNHTMIRYTSA
jgi:arsenate reductase